MSEATLVVQFGAPGTPGATGHLSAEIDRRPASEGGLNNGQTGFAAGSTISLLVYKAANVTVQATASVGTLTETAAPVTVTITEDISFDAESTGQASRPIATLGAVTWIGNNLGALTVQADRLTLKAANPGIGVARVTYTATAVVWRLSTPASVNGQTSYPIQIVFQGTAS